MQPEDHTCPRDSNLCANDAGKKEIILLEYPQKSRISTPQVSMIWLEQGFQFHKKGVTTRNSSWKNPNLKWEVKLAAAVLQSECKKDKLDIGMHFQITRTSNAKVLTKNSHPKLQRSRQN